VRAQPARIWAMGGGKGGSGKSFVAANLATVAARAGRKVVLIDGDLGGANLHTCLGVAPGQRINLNDYFADRVAELDKAAADTPVKGLRLILGALGSAAQAEPTHAKRVQLLKAVRQLSADLVVFDLAAGTDRSVVDFFVAADDAFLVTTPEPTAIENAYQFLRAAFYRRLGYSLQDSAAREVIREAMDRRNQRGIQTPADLLTEIRRVAPEESERLQSALERFRPHLVMNQVRSSEEVKLGFGVRSACRKYFGIEVDYLGYVNYDDDAVRSVKERRPLVLAYPESDGARYLRRITKKLLGD
jgi:flagellar biosynthesis protein FlhG